MVESNRLTLVPPPAEIKRRLGENYREARLLRQLLRLAERVHAAANDRQRERQEVAHAE